MKFTVLGSYMDDGCWLLMTAFNAKVDARSFSNYVQLFGEAETALVYLYSFLMKRNHSLVPEVDRLVASESESCPFKTT